MLPRRPRSTGALMYMHIYAYECVCMCICVYGYVVYMCVYEVFLMISAVMRALLNATAAPLKYRCADIYAYICI